MKIGMLSQWYEPEPGAAAHPTAIARALAVRGHELRVLTAFPSYPTGRVHPGYRMRPRLRERRDGIEVIRVPDVPSHDEGALRRALSLGSFAASATANAGVLRDADVVLTYLTPATVGLAAWTLERLAGVPYVLYVQDLWPETVTASGFVRGSRSTRVIERGLTVLLKGLYARASGVAAISPTMASTIADRGSRVTPVSIPNWVDEQVFKPSPAAATGLLPAGRDWVMYAGGIGDVQALEHAVRAMSLLPSGSTVGLALVGDGVARPRLERLARDLGLEDRVVFLGNRPLQDMPALMAESAAQLVSLRDLPLFRGTIPSKLQASMACGSPVVCAVAGDAADLVRRSGCGLVVRPESPDELATAFQRVAGLSPEERHAWAAAGRRTYADDLSAATGSARLEAVLVDAIRGCRG